MAYETSKRPMNGFEDGMCSGISGGVYLLAEKYRSDLWIAREKWFTNLDFVYKVEDGELTVRLDLGDHLTVCERATRSGKEWVTMFDVM